MHGVRMTNEMSRSPATYEPVAATEEMAAHETNDGERRHWEAFHRAYGRLFSERRGVEPETLEPTANLKRTRPHRASHGRNVALMVH